MLPRLAQRIRPRWWLVVGLAALLIKLWAVDLHRSESSVHLTLQCVDDHCTAWITGGSVLRIEIPERPRHDLVGLYVYHPFGSDSPQHFRNLTLRSASTNGSTIDLPLTEPAERHRFGQGPGWTVLPGQGMSHQIEMGSRAVLPLEQPIGTDFTLEVDLVSFEDAGVIVRASDSDNGMLFVARRQFNDAFFFPLEQGRPGAIEQIAPLREPETGRELLRVGGLVSEILLVSLLFIGICRLLVVNLPKFPVPQRWSHRILERDRPPSWCLSTLFVVTFGAMLVVALFGFDGIPHVNDGAAYLFQAKIFSGGALWAPPPELPDFFRHEHILITEGRWFAKYPPMFPLLLALGVFVGAPWVINPLLGAITALVTYYLARELTDWKWALVAWLLVLSSPFFVIMGGSMLSHMTAALFVSLALLLTLRGLRRTSYSTMALAGVCLGAAIFARPYTALLASLAVGGLVVARLRRPRSVPVIRLGSVLVVCTCLLAVAFLGWNLFLTAADRPSLNLYASYDGTDTLGFGPEKGEGWWMTWGSYGHTPAKALRSVHMFLDYTADHFLGWPFKLSFVLLVAAMIQGWRKVELWSLLGVWLLLVGGYMLYWATQHIGYGARYWFSSVPALMVLSAIGLRWMLTGEGSAEPSNPGNVAGANPRRPAPRLVSEGSFLVVLLLLGMFVWNLTAYFPVRWDELHNYGGVNAALKREVQRQRLQDALVFVRTEGLIYNDGFFLNDPFMRANLIFARDLGPRNADLLAAHRTFRGYRWNGKRLEPMPEPEELSAEYRREDAVEDRR